jgi:hypothetical protein
VVHWLGPPRGRRCAFVAHPWTVSPTAAPSPRPAPAIGPVVLATRDRRLADTVGALAREAGIAITQVDPGAAPPSRPAAWLRGLDVADLGDPAGPGGGVEGAAGAPVASVGFGPAIVDDDVPPDRPRPHPCFRLPSDAGALTAFLERVAAACRTAVLPPIGWPLCAPGALDPGGLSTWPSPGCLLRRPPPSGVAAPGPTGGDAG